MEFKEIKFENNPEWDSIEFKGKWTSMSVDSVDQSGDVSITISVSGEPDLVVFITQENIQQLITHLQKQLK